MASGTDSRNPARYHSSIGPAAIRLRVVSSGSGVCHSRACYAEFLRGSVWAYRYFETEVAATGGGPVAIRDECPGMTRPTSTGCPCLCHKLPGAVVHVVACCELLDVKHTDAGAGEYERRQRRDPARLFSETPFFGHNGCLPASFANTILKRRDVSRASCCRSLDSYGA